MPRPEKAWLFSGVPGGNNSYGLSDFVFNYSEEEIANPRFPWVGFSKSLDRPWDYCDFMYLGIGALALVGPGTTESKVQEVAKQPPLDYDCFAWPTSPFGALALIAPKSSKVKTQVLENNWWYDHYVYFDSHRPPDGALAIVGP